MPRFFKILLIFLLFASSGAYDFSHCVKYYGYASSSTQEGQSISLKSLPKDQGLIFSPTPLESTHQIIKADPFIGLYIIKRKPTKFSYHLLKIDTYARSKELSSISSKGASKGKILKNQTGFLNYARFSAPVSRNGVIGNICYQIYGIGVGGEYFIDKTYIDRFLKQKSPYYGDIGIRVVQKDKQLMVYQVDPFFENNPFLFGDVIVSIDGSKLDSYADFEWKVSNLAYKKPIEVSIIRNHQKQNLKVIVDRHYGGFLLPDTFLERFGIWLDESLTISRIDENASKHVKEFQVGDRIVWIDRKPVLNPQDDSWQKVDNSLRTALSEAGLKGENIEVLIMRNGLEFYLKIRK